MFFLFYVISTTKKRVVTANFKQNEATDSCVTITLTLLELEQISLQFVKTRDLTETKAQNTLKEKRLSKRKFFFRKAAKKTISEEKAKNRTQKLWP